MNRKAKILIKWTWLMGVVALLLFIVCLMPGLHFLVFGLTLIGSLISIIWVGVLLHAISYD
jgi:hypothetical protein